MLENLKMDILLLNRFMSLHVGLYSKRSMHASLKLVFQPSSFIDQSPSLVHRSPWHLALSRQSLSTKSGRWAGDTSRTPSTTKHATLRNGLILKVLVMCSSNSANLTITRRDWYSEPHLRAAACPCRIQRSSSRSRETATSTAASSLRSWKMRRQGRSFKSIKMPCRAKWMPLLMMLHPQLQIRWSLQMLSEEKNEKLTLDYRCRSTLVSRHRPCTRGKQHKFVPMWTIQGVFWRLTSCLMVSK